MIVFMCLLHLPGQDDNTVNGFIVLIPTPTNGHIESIQGQMTGIHTDAPRFSLFKKVNELSKPGSRVKLCSIFFLVLDY